MATALVAAVAYAAIAYAIISGLVASSQLRSNRLGAATALIFVTVAGYCLILGLELLAPSLGLGKGHGNALRDGFDWHMAVWGVLTAAAAVRYLLLRRSRADAAP